jgi:hypothetical protein
MKGKHDRGRDCLQEFLYSRSLRKRFDLLLPFKLDLYTQFLRAMCEHSPSICRGYGAVTAGCSMGPRSGGAPHDVYHLTLAGGNEHITSCFTNH